MIELSETTNNEDENSQNKQVRQYSLPLEIAAHLQRRQGEGWGNTAGMRSSIFCEKLTLIPSTVTSNKYPSGKSLGASTRQVSRTVMLNRSFCVGKGKRL